MYLCTYIHNYMFGESIHGRYKSTIIQWYMVLKSSIGTLTDHIIILLIWIIFQHATCIKGLLGTNAKHGWLCICKWCTYGARDTICWKWCQDSRFFQHKRVPPRRIVCTRTNTHCSWPMHSMMPANSDIFFIQSVWAIPNRYKW